MRCCILSGAVPRGGPRGVLERHEHRFNKSDRGMRAVKAVAEDGTKVVGIRYPEDLLSEVRERVAQEWAARDDQENATRRRQRRRRRRGKNAGRRRRETRWHETERVSSRRRRGVRSASSARGFAWRRPRPWIQCVRRAMRAPNHAHVFSQTGGDGEGSAARGETDRVGGGSRDDPIALDGTGTGTDDANGGGSSARSARAWNATRAGPRGRSAPPQDAVFLRAAEPGADAGARGRAAGPGGTHHVFHLPARVFGHRAQHGDQRARRRVHEDARVIARAGEGRENSYEMRIFFNRRRRRRTWYDGDDRKSLKFQAGTATRRDFGTSLGVTLARASDDIECALSDRVRARAPPSSRRVRVRARDPRGTPSCLRRASVRGP